MRAGLRQGIPPNHDGRWGKATLEVALAIQQSAREGRDVALKHQVGVKLIPEDKRPGKMRVTVTARIAD